MKLHNIIQRAIDFGTFRSRENIFSFSFARKKFEKIINQIFSSCRSYIIFFRIFGVFLLIFILWFFILFLLFGMGGFILFSNFLFKNVKIYFMKKFYPRKHGRPMKGGKIFVWIGWAHILIFRSWFSRSKKYKN